MTDRGSATIWVLAASLLVAVAVAAGLLRGVGVLARHRAEAAADLAALAAAQHVLAGAESSCSAASRYAAANGAELVECDVFGDVVEVRVERLVRVGRLGVFRAVGRARAGPAQVVADGWRRQGLLVDRMPPPLPGASERMLVRDPGTPRSRTVAASATTGRRAAARA